MQNDPEEDKKKVKERAKARTTPTKKKKTKKAAKAGEVPKTPSKKIVYKKLKVNFWRTRLHDEELGIHQQLKYTAKTRVFEKLRYRGCY